MSTRPLSLSKLNAEIKRRNTRFDRASAAQRRVMVAQDVIDQLKIGRMSACTGTWVDAYDNTVDGTADANLQKAVLGNEVSCEVCGLGSLMVSLVLFKNKVKTEDAEYLNPTSEDSDAPDAGLSAVFSQEQMELIEIAFEQGEGAYDVETAVHRAAQAFGEQHEDENQRLRAIMTNIVQHKGEFVVEVDQDKELGYLIDDDADIAEGLKTAFAFLTPAQKAKVLKAAHY